MVFENIPKVFSKKRVSRRRFVKSVSLAALFGITLTSLPKRTEADVPDLLRIEDISQDSLGKIWVRIRHASPSSNHFVDIVEVDVDGQITEFTLQPQDSDPFEIEFELGEIQGTPNVSARPHCNIHGWGAWSKEIEIPEFTSAVAVALGALTASLFLFKRLGKVPS